MADESINNDEQQKIIELFKKHQEKEISGFSKINEEIKKVYDVWEKIKQKINNDNEFKLDDYTNLASNNKEYLCYFLETGSKILGSSRPGNSSQYGIYRANDIDQKYMIDKNAYACDNEEITKKFNGIKEILKDICSDKEVIEKIKTIETQSIISAKQILRKILVLNHPKEFIQIFQDDAINNLFDMLNLSCGEEKECSCTLKNHLIAKWAVEELKIDSNSDSTEDEIDELSKMSLRSRFLWNLSQEYNLFDGSSKNIILYGAPGTGKTYTIEKFKEQQDLRGNKCEIVQFHPSYSYEDFMEGFKPSGIDENGQMKFELVNGKFKNFCIEANKYKEKNYYFIIDEINRANLSAVFGELLYCLEYRHRGGNEGLVATQYSNIIENMSDGEKNSKAFLVVEGKVKFGIPENVYIIGMMNDVDRSIDAFDLALRRRFRWIRMDCNTDVLRDVLDYTNLEDYVSACEKLNKYISNDLNLGKSYEFGHSFFLKIKDVNKNKTDKISQNMLNKVFENYLESTLKEYLRANFSEKDIDDKMNSAKKIFSIKDENDK